MDLGKFFQDAGRNIGNFFGWNQSEEEKRRKAEEARQKAEQQRQQQQQQKAQQPTGLLSVPTITTQKTQPTPQQTGVQRPTVENPFMIEKPKEQAKPQAPAAKSEAEQIQGYYVMSPAAQQKAIADLRSKGATPEEQKTKLKEKLKSGKPDIKELGTYDPTIFKQAVEENAAEKKAADEENLKTIGNIPIIGTMGQWGAGLASLYGQATNNQDLVKDANNRRDLLTLGMNSEELAKFDPETQDKLRVLQNVVTGAGVFDVFGAASLAKAPIIGGVKTVAKEGLTEASKTALKETGKQTLKQYKNNVIAGTLVGGVADPAIQAYIKDGQVDWSSVPSSMLQGGLWAAALPEFSSKQKLVQKMAKGEALTPQESVDLNKALRDAEGAEVPDQTSFAPLDDTTQTKIQDLRTQAEKTPQPEGTTRLYQMTEGDIDSPNYFNNPEQLANYINGRSQNGTVRFVDVPTERVAPVAGKKGEAGVFEIKPDEGSVEGVKRMLAQADEPQQVIDDVQTQAAAQQQGGSSRGISYDDVMNTLRERNRVYNEADPETRAEMNQRASEKNPDDVDFDSPYAREAVYKDLRAAGLEPQDITTLSNRYEMTANDWRTVLNASRDLSGARNVAAVLDSQIKKVLGKQQTTAYRPTVDTPQGKVYSDTGEFVDDVPPAGGTPPVDPDLNEQLTVAERLAKAIQDAREIVERLNAAVKELGFEPEELRRKMQAANRGEYQMTEAEAAAARIYSDRLTQARQSLEESGVKFDGKQLYYTPQVREGEAGLPSTREELSNFGYGKSRKNAMELDELEYGDLPLVDYLVKAENRDLVVQDAMIRAADTDGRAVTPEGIEAAAKKTVELQSKVQQASKSEKVLDNDTVADLNEIGRGEGYVQQVNDVKAGAISQEPREMLSRAGVYDHGFEQFDNSVAYATEFSRIVNDNNIPREQLQEALTRAIRSAMPNAEESSVQEAVNGAVRRINNRNLTGMDIQPQVASAFRSVSKAELFRLGKTMDFSDKKMKAVVNEQMNARLMQDTYSKNFAQGLDSFIAQRINASLRGGNVVSAAFELGDIANILSNYGLKGAKDAKFGFGKVDDNMLGMSARYGEADPHFLSSDIPEVNKLNEIWSDDKTNIAQKIKRSYETVENKLLVFRYVEQYKTELFFRQADAFYRSKGLQGTELVNKVQQDYLNTMLPNKIITANRLIGKMPNALTQYLNWSLQATKRLGRTLAGTNEAGVYGGMSRGSRVVRGLTTEVAPKVAIAALLGVPIQQVMGMRDWTGATDGDFSGIDDEDKTALDHIMSYVGMSPLLGMASNTYFAGRREQEAVEDGEEANPNWFAESMADNAGMLIPFRTQFNKSANVQEGVNDGYFQNKDGRVQFAAPEAGSLEHIMGLITGKTYMPSNRDYQDNPDIMSVLRGEASLADLFTHNQSVDNAVQAFGGDTARDYSRPVSDSDFVIGKDEYDNPITFNYNDTVKGAFAENREAGLAKLDEAKGYNEILDRVRREQPEAYEAYQAIMDNNDLVSPEYWSALSGTNSEGDFDLTLIRMIGDRKKAIATASGAENSYDPMYDLPDDQLRALVQLKSTATGDDLALRNILYKSQWYNDYVDARKAYSDGMPVMNEQEREVTERVKQWDAYSDNLNALSMLNTPELQQQYPYNAAYKAAQSEYESKTGKDFYGSEESKQWFRLYGDGKKAEDANLDSAKLQVINAMRVIEGFPPMTPEQYAQATEIADTSGSSGGSGGGGGGGQYDFVPEFYNSFEATKLAAPKTASVDFKPNTSVGRRTNSKKNLGARSGGGDKYSV